MYSAGSRRERRPEVVAYGLRAPKGLEDGSHFVGGEYFRRRHRDDFLAGVRYGMNSKW